MKSDGLPFNFGPLKIQFYAVAIDGEKLHKIHVHTTQPSLQVNGVFYAVYTADREGPTARHYAAYSNLFVARVVNQ
jgi:hypothetical protein